MCKTSLNFKGLPAPMCGLCPVVEGHAWWFYCTNIKHEGSNGLLTVVKLANSETGGGEKDRRPLLLSCNHMKLWQCCKDQLKVVQVMLEQALEWNSTSWWENILSKRAAQKIFQLQHMLMNIHKGWIPVPEGQCALYSGRQNGTCTL